ncbi:molybdopterin cofactor-binding domain-containing protein [Pseudomonas sp. DSP3-2-2]|uniref:molybdopterin cofactor-binding domain-containing protein n=1 Tax=unclassified Pseudomonas TaxID=196821 RepID=UPI003CEDC507
MPQALLNRDQLLAKTGVLLIIDTIEPPSMPLAKGGVPAFRKPEKALFIAVNDDGHVYAFNGHVDLGTGIRTALAQIVAEELDVALDQVRMILGDTANAPDQGPTIASATIQIAAIPLRNAAAEARRFLLQRAAERLNVTLEALRIESGKVLAADGRTLSFAELVADEHDELGISGTAPLKNVADYRLVGKGAARVDIPGKATGELTYVHDMRLPNMLHGRVIRPPYAGLDSGDFVGNSLLEVDEASIAHVPGVVRVVVIRDFVGVVALREEQAAKAAQLLKVTWKDWNHKLPDMDDVAQAIRANPRVQRVVLDQGNIENALAQASQRMPRRYVWPYQMHASIGPSCALADYQPAGLRVWSGTQNPHLLRADLAWLLECPDERIEIIRMEASGCYGRNCADDVSADAALLSRAVGLPVRVQLTREQEHVWEPKGAAQLMEVDGGLNADGGVAGYDFQTSYPSNDAPTLALLLTARVEPVAAMFEMGDRTSVAPYDFEHMRVTINDMAPVVRASWMRGVSALPNTFAHESYIDELAFAAGVDPVEYRLRYLRDERGAELVRATAARAQWTPRSEPMSIPEEDNVLRGRGFAYARYMHSKFPGSGAAWAAWVADVAVDRLSGEVSVTRVVVGHDAGMMVNPAGVQHQIHGNVIQSTSRVLKEQVTFERSTVASKEWGGYPILTFAQVPDIDVLMMPRQNEPPMGAGESAAVPSAAAIANALYDATGIRFRELPITAERVLAALNGAEAKTEGPVSAPAKAKRFRGWFGSIILALGVLLGSALPWRAEIAPIAPPDPGTWSAVTLERGRLLAAAGDCAVCHTAPDGATNAGGRALQTPFGTLYTSNITPHAQTGIGNWSYPAFERAMREGISRDGKHLYPAFPYTAFRNIEDADMQALYAWLMAQAPVSQPARSNELRYPWNLRPLLAGWNGLFLRSGEFQAQPERGEQWNRGAYLVNGLGHCAACHSPRNALGAEKAGVWFLAGGAVDGWDAPALNGLSRGPTPWTEEQLFTYLSTGYSDAHGVAAGPMGPVVSELSKLPSADIRAMANYLVSLDTSASVPPQSRPSATADSSPGVASLNRGKRIFEGACQGCHADGKGPKLFGVSPSLASNTNLHSQQPDNLLKIILSGIATPATPDLGYMPGFKDSLSDTQISELTAYLRNRFAPNQPHWSGVREKVAQLRANPGAH